MARVVLYIKSASDPQAPNARSALTGASIPFTEVDLSQRSGFSPDDTVKPENIDTNHEKAILLEILQRIRTLT